MAAWNCGLKGSIQKPITILTPGPHDKFLFQKKLHGIVYSLNANREANLQRGPSACFCYFFFNALTIYKFSTECPLQALMHVLYSALVKYLEAYIIADLTGTSAHRLNYEDLRLVITEIRLGLTQSLRGTSEL